MAHDLPQTVADFNLTLEHDTDLDQPPANWDPITADDDSLLKYGFPPRPDPNVLQQASAFWKESISGPLRYVPPRPKEERHLKSLTWSGGILLPHVPLPARLPPPSPGEKFFSISGFWIVPNVYPPPTHTHGICPPPLEPSYRCYSFVGFDGWEVKRTESTPPALMFGTKSVIEGDRHFAKVFLRVQGREWDFCLPVMPGDLVSAHLWLLPDQRHFRVFIVNRNTGQRTGAIHRLPESFRGRSAEWILGRQRVDYGKPSHPRERLPNYGATFYHKTCALAISQPLVKRIPWQSVREFTVDDSYLIDMVEAGSKDVISTAEHVQKNALLVYAYEDEPKK